MDEGRIAKHGIGGRHGGRMKASQLEVGTRAPAFIATTLAGTNVIVPNRGRVVHLQFRRFAGCPICNLHVRSVARRIDELGDAGIREIAVFHSEAETMRPFQGDLPFEVIADPERHLYDLYGVGSGARSILDPRAWPAFFRGMAARYPKSNFVGEGGHTGLPADFLVSADGTIAACNYGKHADDQWSVDEILDYSSSIASPSASRLTKLK